MPTNFLSQLINFFNKALKTKLTMSSAFPYILGLLIAVFVIVVIHLLDRYIVRYPFWKRKRLYPISHQEAIDHIFKYIEAITSKPSQSDDDFVKILLSQSISRIDAELIVRFVPIAFTWVLVRKMGITSFPGTFVVLDTNQKPRNMPIAEEHYFLSALGVADEIVKDGFTHQVSRTTFEAIISRSAEMDAVNQALSAGRKIPGGKILSPILLGISAEEIAEHRKARNR
jgi:hypothetical protein